MLVETNEYELKAGLLLKMPNTFGMMYFEI